MTLWFFIALLTLVMLAICFYPLFRPMPTGEGVKREELNKAFYFNRLQELERDEQLGLLENSQQLKTELQQSLLQDIPSEQAQTKQTAFNPKIALGTGLFLLIVIAGASYLKVGSPQAEMMMSKTYQKLPYFFDQLKAQKELSETELQQFSTALRLKLQDEPKNASLWSLLGKVAMQSEKWQLALDAYAQANKLEPDNVDYKIEYARILVFSSEKEDKEKGLELLKQVVRKDHSNIEALNLLAFQYFEAEDYKMAALTWAMVLKLMPADDPRVPVIERSIQTARESQKANEK